MRPALVIATNSTKLNHIPALIFNAITDFSHYSFWWAGASFAPLGETQMRVKPKGIGSFIWTIQENIPNKRLELRYEGMFEGTGIWELEQKGSYTKVTYKVELVIKHPLLKLVNALIPVATLHGKMMEQVFVSLDGYLNNFHVKS